MANNMDGIGNIIGQLLSDPSAKEKLSQVISALANTDSAQTTQAEDQEIGSLGAIESNPAVNDGDAITKAMNALSGLNTANDPRVTLLESLKPYIRSNRASKIDLAVKVMQFSKIAPLFGINILGNKGPKE